MVIGVSWWCFCVFVFQVVRFVYLLHGADAREVYTDQPELGLELEDVWMGQALCAEGRAGKWALQVHVLGCLGCRGAFEINSC